MANKHYYHEVRNLLTGERVKELEDAVYTSLYIAMHMADLIRRVYPHYIVYIWEV